MVLHYSWSVLKPSRVFRSLETCDVAARSRLHWTLLAVLAALFGVICDGWSGKPSPLIHQLALLPFDLAYVLTLVRLVAIPTGCDGWEHGQSGSELPRYSFSLLVCFQLMSSALVVLESRHFRAFGYRLPPPVFATSSAITVLGWAWFLMRRTGARLLAAVLASYLAAFFVAITSFPLNYLRSDMLPVISWADARWLQHMNPYGTMHVGVRTYDFPYLPGMLVAYWPAAALHIDLRDIGVVYLLASVGMIWWLSRRSRSLEVAATVGLLLLNPFLQYRHDLYLQPHWFLLTGAVALMRCRRFLWSAAIWGASCAVYQFSWVVLPFVLLYAYRRRGIREAAKAGVFAVLGAAATAGVLLLSAFQRIRHNTIGQWAALPHALADPINASYWLTYVVRPSQLQWVQAALLTALFLYCCLRGKCADLADTLRWMCCALGVFIPLNVIVDGYFYLTLLVLMILYVCVANDWWREPAAEPGVDLPDRASVAERTRLA